MDESRIRRRGGYAKNILSSPTSTTLEIETIGERQSIDPRGKVGEHTNKGQVFRTENFHVRDPCQAAVKSYDVRYVSVQHL